MGLESDFINENLPPSYDTIDFSKAKKLKSEGSTCDTYEIVWQRRRVFVKKLKDKYLFNPLYKAAFDKEYDIGITLKHKSLPEYREFHGDYIIMDFIDGFTLAELIERKDPWLNSQENVIKILSELVDVVDYLHSKNIVHCDIKPSNILISNGNKNLILVDLDKCYTDWLNSTSGNSEMYGINSDKPGNPAIDWNGVSKIADKLINQFPSLQKKKFVKFKNDCLKSPIDSIKLKGDLTAKRNYKNWFFMIPLITMIIAGMIAWEKNIVSKSDTISNIVTKKDTIVVLHQPITSDEPITKIESKLTEPIGTISENKKERKINEEVDNRPYYILEIEKDIPNRFEPLHNLIDKAQEKLAAPGTPIEELQELLFELTILKSDLLMDAYKFYEEKYPKENSLDIQMAVAKASEKTPIIIEMIEIHTAITDTIVGRLPKDSRDYLNRF